jgi:outer membrane protein
MRVRVGVKDASARRFVAGYVRARRGALLVVLVSVLAVLVTILPNGPTRAQRRIVETLPEALVQTYQGNPALNAERARLRGTDEGVSQAMAGYRPQILASMSAGLQAVRVMMPDNTIQTATLRSWTIGLTVTQTLFNGFKTANTVRQSEAQVQSGREALRNTGQGVMLDAVTAYMNVLANQSLVDAQRINVTFLRETLTTTRKRLDAGDVTPTDVAQAEARPLDSPGFDRPAAAAHA